MENLLAVATGGLIGSPAGYIIASFTRKSVQFVRVSSAGLGAVVLGFFIAQPRRL